LNNHFQLSKLAAPEVMKIFIQWGQSWTNG